MLLAKCCWHDKGWTMCWFFQCSSTDEHNASMQLARERFMVAVQKKIKWKIALAVVMVIFP